MQTVAQDRMASADRRKQTQTDILDVQNASTVGDALTRSSELPNLLIIWSYGYARFRSNLKLDLERQKGYSLFVTEPSAPSKPSAAFTSFSVDWFPFRRVVGVERNGEPNSCIKFLLKVVS
jgi:hypothetical protein